MIDNTSDNTSDHSSDHSGDRSGDHTPGQDSAETAEPEAYRPVDPGRPGRAPRSWIVPGAIAVIVAFAVGYCAGDRPGRPAAEHDHGGQTESAIWTCAMHPQIRAPEPGKCPICGMDLVELTTRSAGSEDATGHDDARITLGERARILAGIRTVTLEPVVPSTRTRELRLLGKIDYDETRVKTVTAWTGGRIDRLLVATTGQRVTRGQPIARLYSPEIFSAHSDLIQARKQVTRLQSSSELTRLSAEAARDAARQRLRLLGIPAAELARLEAAETPARETTIRSRAGGTVIARLVDEGNYVAPGTALYRVADLARVWVQLEAYERDLVRLAVGDRVALTVSGLPGERFEGKVAFIDPTVDPRTRIARVRVEVGNRRGVLRPGMFAEAVLHGAHGPPPGGAPSGEASPGDAPSGEASEEPPPTLLVVPESAPLFTGERSIVYVEVTRDSDRGSSYQAREVTLGPRLGDGYPVLDGLAAGERVVVRGAFVIDADLQIQGGSSMMTRERDETVALGPLSPPLAKSLTQVIDRYLAGQRALAGDDAEAARRAGREVATAVGAAGPRIPERLRGAWDPLAVALATHGQNMGRADDLAAARRSFESLSGSMIELLSHFGNPGDETLHLAYCPMAFDGRGASWLQLGTTIANAYHGADMLGCGSIHSAVAPGMHLEAGTGSPTDTPASDPAHPPATPGHTGHGHP